ncbi:hypothetical protein C0J52_15796 [Blattella germanica]|nr:hypothetical protein C0J52_15796 [Blattella germanica]
MKRGTVKINISEENWITHYNKLWTNEDKDINTILGTMAEIDSIVMEELHQYILKSVAQQLNIIVNIYLFRMSGLPFVFYRRTV